jgi:hypothetical protein
MTALLKVWAWAAGHRPAWGVIAAVAWTAIMYLILRQVVIALLCGAAFGAVSATSLHSPPNHRER